MTRTAEAELRRHARERHRRAAVRAQDMESALTLVRDDAGMSSETWVESCLLMRGVGPVDDAERARFWAMVELMVCGINEDAPAARRQEVAPPPRFSQGPGDSGAREWAETLPVWPEEGEGASSAAMTWEIAAGLTLHEAAHRVGVGPRLANRWWSDAVERVGENQKALESREARG